MNFTRHVCLLPRTSMLYCDKGFLLSIEYFISRRCQKSNVIANGKVINLVDTDDTNEKDK